MEKVIRCSPLEQYFYLAHILALLSTFHIYLNDRCLFKDLNEKEFDVIWGRLYRSYYKEEITYTEVTDIPNEKYIDASY